MRRNFLDNLNEFLSIPDIRYLITITVVVSSMTLLQIGYSTGRVILNVNIPEFLSGADKRFLELFIEWFGVFYGFVISGVLLKVWDEFQSVTKVINQEENELNKIFNLLLDPQIYRYVLDIIVLLRDYTEGMISLIDGQTQAANEMSSGNQIITDMKDQLHIIIGNSRRRSNQFKSSLSKLDDYINNLSNLRLNRNSVLADQFFRNLRSIIVLISITWLVPFYFLNFQQQPGIDLKFGFLGNAFVILITYLVIKILALVDDLGNPFSGNWIINNNAVQILHTNINIVLQREDN